MELAAVSRSSLTTLMPYSLKYPFSAAHRIATVEIERTVPTLTVTSWAGAIPAPAATAMQARRMRGTAGISTRAVVSGTDHGDTHPVDTNAGENNGLVRRPHPRCGPTARPLYRAADAALRGPAAPPRSGPLYRRHIGAGRGLCGVRARVARTCGDHR